MAAAYHIYKNGSVVAVTTTGKTSPGIMKSLPHGRGGGDGVVNKSPGAISPVTGK